MRRAYCPHDSELQENEVIDRLLEHVTVRSQRHHPLHYSDILAQLILVSARPKSPLAVVSFISFSQARRVTEGDETMKER